MLLTSACATVSPPEIGRELRDYPLEAYSPTTPPLDLPTIQIDGVTIVDGEQVAYMSMENFIKLERYEIRAAANTKALNHRNAAFEAVVEERTQLLMACRAAEEQTEVFRSLYIEQSRFCSLTQTVGVGVAAFLAIALGLSL